MNTYPARRSEVVWRLVSALGLTCVMLLASVDPAGAQGRSNAQNENKEDASSWRFDGELNDARREAGYRLRLRGPRHVRARLDGLAGDAELQIVNAGGEVVYQGHANADGGGSLDAELPTGDYQVRVVGESSTTYQLEVSSAILQISPNEEVADADQAGNPNEAPADASSEANRIAAASQDDDGLELLQWALTDPETFLVEHPWLSEADLQSLDRLAMDGELGDADLEAFQELLESREAEQPQGHDAETEAEADGGETSTAEAAPSDTASSTPPGRRVANGRNGNGGSNGGGNGNGNGNGGGGGGGGAGGGAGGGGGGGAGGDSGGGSGGGDATGSGESETDRGDGDDQSPSVDFEPEPSQQEEAPEPEPSHSEEPSQPEAPSEPEPSQPEAPSEPEPSQPEAPSEPEPSQPEAPSEPEPSEPEAPLEPEPSQPEAPSEPEPSQPRDPSGIQPQTTVLSPGDGWISDADQPAAIGEGFGADAQAIAHWNVVPDQAFAGPFNVGVLAYHMLGIDRVAFSVNGGPWVDVNTISLNERTAAEAWATVEAYEGTEEYWVALDAADFTTGPVEVRAIAYPVKGLPRVLEPLRLWANPSGALTGPVIYASADGNDATGDGTVVKPYRTIRVAAHAIGQRQGDHDASGGTVRLLPGEYRLGPYERSTRIYTDHWLTIEAAEGVSHKQVIITGTDGSDGMRTQRLRLHNLTITGQLQSHAGTNGALWVDRCELIGRGRIEPNGWTNGFEAGVWETNTLVRDSRHGMKADFSRNVRLKDIGENGWMSPKLVVDCYVTGIDRPTGADFHMDLVHLRSDENVIIHGLRAENMNSQGIFTGRDKHLRNTAIVNCHIDNSAGGSQRVFQLMGPTEHLVVQSSAFIGSCNWRVDEGFSAHNVMLRNSMFGSDAPFVPNPYEVEGVSFAPSPWLYD